MHLPIDAFPDVSPNMVQVFAESEGMAAEEVEKFISQPVEVSMMGIPGVEKIRSLSSHGLSTVNIFFEEDIDIYFAHQLVFERLKLAEEGIPESVFLPHGLEKSPVLSGMGRILTYYLASETHDVTDLRTIQDWVAKRELQTVPGVAKVLSQGGHVRQYQVKVSPAELLQYNLTMDDVAAAIRENNANLGAGLIERGSEELMVRSLGILKNAEDIENIVLKTHEGVPVYVRDVAQVEFGQAFRRGVASKDGRKEVVVGNIYKVHGANSFEVIERIKERIAEINQTLPEGVKIVPFYDQSVLVRNSIVTVRNALTWGLILVCLVAFIFLGSFRNALIMVCSLPFSVLLALAMMKYADVPGDLISFGGVAIALGMIIDATIIMVEKIQTSLQEARDDKTVSSVVLETAKEIGPPTFFAVAIIIIVFLPIFTLQGVEGRMFRPLAFTVTVTMAGSLFYALCVAPIFYSLLHRERKAEKKGHPALTRFQVAYRRLLLATLKRPAWMAAGVMVLILVGVLTFRSLGKEFVPTLQEGSIQVLVHMNPNVALDTIAETARRMEADILQHPEVASVMTEVGYGEVGPHVHHTNFACITVILRPRSEAERGLTHEEIVNQLDELLADYPGVLVSYSQPIQHEIDGMIAGAGTQVVAKVVGTDFDVLQRKAAEVHDVLSSISGVADLRTDQFSGQTQVQINLKRDQMARHGLNSMDVQRTIRNAIGGQLTGSILEQERSYGINVRFDEPYRKDIAAIENLLIRSSDGYVIPLKQLADIQAVTGLRQVSRENGRRFVSVLCNVRGRDAGGFVEEAQEAVNQKIS
ncbi:MAG TPA: CusA/CzcA family heavy metal efflux RND transporter, partial [Acidobacteriota bacterium]|nr:CusA/CzcA family heavy metal efflux RND transporter [Acidobacteriota bacterium]